MLTIYHNTRCSKSRCAMEIIEESGKEFKVIEYLNTPPTKKELKEILNKLGLKAEQLVRKKESLYLQQFKGKIFTENQWVDILVKNPTLIERPIIVKDDKAILGREEEIVKEFLKSKK